MNNRVKALMVLKGIKQADICVLLGVRASSVSLIVSGKKRSRRIRTAIAQALGVRVEELWPDKSNAPKRAA